MTARIPLHRPLHLPGVHGYADCKSLHAGETVRFHLSADRTHRLSVCRLGHDVEGRSDDEVLQAFAAAPARVQAIHPGSYVHVDKGLDASLPLQGLAVECWVKPWSVDARQCIASQDGWGLFIEAGGALAFHLGDQRQTHGRLDARRWQHVVAQWDGDVASLWIDGIQAAQWDADDEVRPGPSPLRLGACAIGGVADLFLDADILMPVLYARALSLEEIRARHAQQGLVAASGRQVLACWPLREERGATIADCSGHQRTGRIVNHATWMIVGPAFESAKVPVYESASASYDPFTDPTRGHGLRLASDDLYDCRWEVTHEFRIPDSARAGLYVGRVHFELDGREAAYDITFLVKKARHAAPAPILVLCAMNSWLAYANAPFAKNVVDDPVWPRRSTGLENCHPDAPSYNSYTFHRAGQPCYQVGLRMPWPNASPNALYDPANSGFSQWARLERHLHVWLEREGLDFDLVSDIDLHRDPAMLARYRTVFVNGHSEYWSVPALDGLDDYLRQGGSAIVLSGNTMYLRVSYDEEGAVMEQRKVGEPGRDDAEAALRPPAGPFGEQYHSQDWARGGQLKTAGRPAADIVGLESAGWGFASGDDFGVYHVSEPGHVLFNGPQPLGLEKGQTFGHAPGGGLPRAIGHEWDLSVATLARMTRHVPEGATMPAPPAGLQVIAQGLRCVPGPLDTYLDYFSNVAESLDGLSAEMIYWERPQGGRVFHAGAVGAAWVVGSDPLFGRLLRNVLHHFGATT